MSPRLAFALDAALRAGRATLKHFQTDPAIDRKADDSPVTQADRDAESLLRDLIESKFPGEAVLGEEFGGDDEIEERWVIDPIDGTKSFICGVPLFATLLSFERNAKPEVGVAYFPALDEMVYAELGQGAYWNGRPCRVSTIDRLENATIACGGHASAVNTGRLNGILKLAEQTLATRTWCDAYGHCLVASGRVEAMVDPKVSIWDVSAISLIVREAGGSTTDFVGGTDISSEALSTNKSLHEAIVGAFA